MLQERERLVFSNKRASSTTSNEGLQGYKVGCLHICMQQTSITAVLGPRTHGTNADVCMFAVQIGDVLTGVVQSIKPYGAFVDLGGMTGLLHVSQISHERITSLDKVIAEGDKIKVRAALGGQGVKRLGWGPGR